MVLAFELEACLDYMMRRNEESSSKLAAPCNLLKSRPKRVQPDFEINDANVAAEEEIVVLLSAEKAYILQRIEESGEWAQCNGSRGLHVIGLVVKYMGAISRGASPALLALLLRLQKPVARWWLQAARLMSASADDVAREFFKETGKYNVDGFETLRSITESFVQLRDPAVKSFVVSKLAELADGATELSAITNALCRKAIFQLYRTALVLLSHSPHLLKEMLAQRPLPLLMVPVPDEDLKKNETLSNAFLIAPERGVSNFRTLLKLALAFPERWGDQQDSAFWKTIIASSRDIPTPLAQLLCLRLRTTKEILPAEISHLIQSILSDASSEAHKLLWNAILLTFTSQPPSLAHVKNKDALRRAGATARRILRDWELICHPDCLVQPLMLRLLSDFAALLPSDDAAQCIAALPSASLKSNSLRRRRLKRTLASATEL